MPLGVGLLGRGGETPRKIGGKGELVHSRAGLGMAVEEFSFRSGKCEGTSGSSASKNAGFNRSMLTVSSMPFIRKGAVIRRVQWRAGPVAADEHKRAGI